MDVNAASYAPVLTADDHRVVIVGGPMAGKTTLARQLRDRGYPTFCGDPRSRVRELEPDVTYLPEGLDWAQASRYVATEWLPMPGRWVLEGHVMARALRRQLARGVLGVDQVLVLPGPHPMAYLVDAQRPLMAMVLKVWEEIAPRLEAVTQYLTIEQASPAWSPLDGVRQLAKQLDQW